MLLLLELNEELIRKTIPSHLLTVHHGHLLLLPPKFLHVVKDLVVLVEAFILPEFLAFCV